MTSVEKLDKNMVFDTKIEREGLVFKSIEEAPFKVYGVFKNEAPDLTANIWTRMPNDVAKDISIHVHNISRQTAGGRIRFKTDSPYIALNVKNLPRPPMPQLTLVAQVGFDLYIGNEYYNSFVPPSNITVGYESVVDFPTSEMREITLNFPLYYGVEDVFVGIKDGSKLEEASDYLDIPKIVYYGSSITQGGCANRPGNTYESIIARETNVDFVALGFGGGAKGEPSMAEYIASLDMSLFVLDYDHNAPTPEFLNETHENFFKIVRKAQPSLPILIISRPVYYPSPEEILRRDIIKKTYENAVASGDKNVYFIDGTTLLEECKNNGTVDGIHPTDYGFACMAKKICPVIKEILGLK